MLSRREAQKSDKSIDSSIGLDKAIQRSLQLEEKLENEAESSQDLLRRLLSTKSVISTASSFAESQQAAIGSRAPYREIGVGSIGRVFGQSGSPWAFKVLLLDRTEKLWNNYLMHRRVQETFDFLGETAGSVEIPRIAWFADKNSRFWDDNLSLFPDEATFPRRPREVLCMERIFPLPEKIRHAIIDVFCSPFNADKAKRMAANKDCLVRVLLGRKRFGTSRPGGGMFFSLRNFKLHLDQIQKLELEAADYAISMAEALAALHWHAKIDALDVEFVLGSTPIDPNAVRRMVPLKDVERLTPGSSTYEQTTNADRDFKKRLVSLWLLDFDACSTISMDEAGVKQAVNAFFKTDPFCPRPFSQDTYGENLWRLFSERYISTGQKITAGRAWKHLPAMVIKGIMDGPSHRDPASKFGSN